MARFLRCTEEVASSKTWEWLRRGELKKETEGLITAAQDQSSADECDEGKDREITCLSYVQNVQCGRGDCIFTLSANAECMLRRSTKADTTS